MPDTSLNEIKVAVLTKLAATSVTDLIGTSNIFYRRPQQERTVPVITFTFVSTTPDWDTDEYGKIDILMQLDIWTTTADLGQEVAGEVDALLYQYNFSTTSWEVKRFLRRGDREEPRDDEGIARLSTDWLITAYQKN